MEKDPTWGLKWRGTEVFSGSMWKSGQRGQEWGVWKRDKWPPRSPFVENQDSNRVFQPIINSYSSMAGLQWLFFNSYSSTATLQRLLFFSEMAPWNSRNLTYNQISKTTQIHFISCRLLENQTSKHGTLARSPMTNSITRHAEKKKKQPFLCYIIPKIAASFLSSHWGGLV